MSGSFKNKGKKIVDDSIKHSKKRASHENSPKVSKGSAKTHQHHSNPCKEKASFQNSLDDTSRGLKSKHNSPEIYKEKVVRQKSSEVPRGIVARQKSFEISEEKSSRQNSLEVSRRSGSRKNSPEICKVKSSRQNSLEVSKERASRQNSSEICKEKISRQSSFEFSKGSRQNSLEVSKGSRQNSLEVSKGSRQNSLEVSKGSRQNSLEISRGSVSRQNSSEGHKDSLSRQSSSDVSKNSRSRQNSAQDKTEPKSEPVKIILNFLSNVWFDDSSSEKEEKAIAAIKKEPIPVEQFLQRLRQKKLDKYLNFEVRAIVRNQEEYSCMKATQIENIPKNVCQDVLPYDHSCVTLRDPPEGYDSDYINASFIEGFDGGRDYIATQGPKGKTVPAFWHLVWQEGVHCIVMATGLFENSLQQCDKYWGDVLSVQKHVQQGDVHIFLDSILELSRLTIRTFHIQKDGCDERRVVKHFEMVGFSDETTDPGFLLDVRRRVNKFMLTSSGPLLVHCRCGGGKTAVFIAIDFCLKQLESEKFVDIYSTVLFLRKFRQNMVRTLAQYRLIYDTLALHVQAWTTVVPSSQLPHLTRKLALKDSYTHLQGFEREFKLFQDIVANIPIGDCASGHRDENRNKSRDIMLLPPERARPYLQTMETHQEGTDFINAVFVEGYHQPNKYLVTQWPMQTTINDIWRLLYDFKICSLVVLNEAKYSRNFPCFWPRDLDKEVKFGPIGVKYVGCQKYPHIIIRAFSIRKRAACLPLIDVLHGDNDSMIVKMFQYTSWHHRDKTPISTKSFLYMMGCVNDWQESNNSFKPVCVMSKDGFSRSGVYCTLSICCEQLESEREVDVFNAVRLVKQNRPQLVPTLNEYIYCYSYMSLLVEFMHEDRPKIVVTTPPNVIEGEIRQGYEQVTGFQNILSPYDDEVTTEKHEKPSKHSLHGSFSVGGRLSSVSDRLSGVGRQLSGGGGQKNQRSSIEEPEENQQISNNGLCSFDIGNKVSNSNNKLNPGRKYSRQSSATDTRHLRENGYLVENESVRSHRNSNVSAPKAPGRIRTSKSESDSFQLESKGVPDFSEIRAHNSARKTLQRQNASEMDDLSPDVEVYDVFGNKRSFDSTCL